MKVGKCFCRIVLAWGHQCCFSGDTEQCRSNKIVQMYKEKLVMKTTWNYHQKAAVRPSVK